MVQPRGRGKKNFPPTKEHKRWVAERWEGFKEQGERREREREREEDRGGCRSADECKKRKIKREARGRWTFTSRPEEERKKKS